MKIRWDTANRSFFALVGVALLPYLLLGFVGCGVLSLAAHRVATEGLAALSAGPGDLRPLLAILSVIVAGTVSAAVSVVRQWGATRRLADRIRDGRLAVTPDLQAAADAARLRGRVDLVDDPEPVSFAYGFPRPRVVVSRGLLETVTSEELAAVLAHERHHVRNHDPLKVLLARVLASAFFYLPALRGLSHRYSAASELAADRRAMNRVGRAPLAGALYRVVRGGAWDELAAAAAIGGPELLDVRVEQLETGREPPVSPVSRTSALATAAVLGMIVAAVGVAVIGLGGIDAIKSAMMSGREARDMGPGWHDLAWIGPTGVPPTASIPRRARPTDRHRR